MLINGIGVNTAGMMMAAERGIPENETRIQPEKSMFGPEYEVTISEEGRALSEQQTSPAEMATQGGQPDEGAKALLSQLKEARLAEETRYGYWDELDDIEKQIKVMNAAYGRMRDDLSYDDPAMKEVVEQQRLLKEEMQEQKDFQTEEGLRRLREALQLAEMKSAQYKDEIDENNRDLVALLRTMEEARKAEDEREDGGSKDGDSDASGTENSASDAIHRSANGFMKSSLNREKGIDELSDTVGNSGRSFLQQANDIAQSLLKKSASIKEAIADKSFTNGQIDEMMVSFRSEVKAESVEAYIRGSFGTQVLRDMRDARIQRIADNPLQNMQQTKDGMMQAAVDASLSEARQSSLDETSRKLADEVERLIDERNHVDRVSQGQEKEKEQEEEQNNIQKELLKAEE